MVRVALSFLIPIASLVTLVLTSNVLRRRLKLPPWPTGTSKPSRGEFRQEEFVGTPDSELQRHWHGWITIGLPAALGCAMFAAGLWFIADVGWFAVRLSGHGGQELAALPGLGSIRAFTLQVLVGIVASGGAGFACLIVVVLGYYLGRTMIWPDVRDDIDRENYYQKLAYGGARKRRTALGKENCHEHQS